MGDVVPAAPAPAPDTTLAHPLERAIVDDMSCIVRGGMHAVPRFVRHLMCYFEDGVRPEMTPAELSHHLADRASFVLTSLFHLPEVAQERTGMPTIVEADGPANETADETGPANETAEGATPAAAPPRWFDALLGVCLLTPAWKLSAASGALQLAHAYRPVWTSRSRVAALAVGLLCIQPAPDALGVVGDVLLLGAALDTHQRRYTWRACAWTAACAACRVAA